jgi:hypothetical protein
MGVEKFNAGEFLALFSLSIISFLVQFEDYSLKKFLVEINTKATTSGNSGSKSTPWLSVPVENFFWYLLKSLYISSFLVFYKRYDSLTISNEDNADFFLISLMFVFSFLGMLFIPFMLHNCTLKMRKQKNKNETETEIGTGLGWFIISMIWTVGFNIVLMSLYFSVEEYTSAGLQMIFVIILIVAYFVWYRKINTNLCC